MPIRSIRALRALPLAAMAAALLAPAADAAGDAVAELRVVQPGGALERGISYVTNTVKVKTDPGADCFAGGSGGSGDRVKIPGPTAMGILKSAGSVNEALRPLSITDEFGFGLGLCGIGGVEGDASRYWSLTVNHQAAQVGGDQLTLADGDVVLWNLTGFPPDPELELRAAPGTSPGSLEVTVVRWVCSTAFPPPDPVCAEEPAAGATVSGGDAPASTNASGTATVSLASAGDYALEAALPSHLPSNRARVCVSATAGECPAPTDPVGATIAGGHTDDDFAATAGWDAIRSGRGDDRVDIRAGGSDSVNCGAGRDRVVRFRADADDEIRGNCERVLKKP